MKPYRFPMIAVLAAAATVAYVAAILLTDGAAPVPPELNALYVPGASAASYLVVSGVALGALLFGMARRDPRAVRRVFVEALLPAAFIPSLVVAVFHFHLGIHLPATAVVVAGILGAPALAFWFHHTLRTPRVDAGGKVRP